MKYFISICLLIGGISCTEFLSPQVSDHVLVINSPTDSLTTNQELITFWWEEDSDAEAYRLQVISPNFDNPQYVFDTVLGSTQLQKSFPDNTYSWRIRIENEGSMSDWQKRSFTVDSTYTE